MGAAGGAPSPPDEQAAAMTAMVVMRSIAEIYMTGDFLFCMGNPVSRSVLWERYEGLVKDTD